LLDMATQDTSHFSTERGVAQKILKVERSEYEVPLSR